MSACMPCFVKDVGKRLNMTPMSWNEYPDRVVIVFEEGCKLSFPRTPEAEPTPEPAPAKPARKPRKAKK